MSYLKDIKYDKLASAIKVETILNSVRGAKSGEKDPYVTLLETFITAYKQMDNIIIQLDEVNKDLKQNDNEPIEAAFVKKNAISEQLFILEQVFQTPCTTH